MKRLSIILASIFSVFLISSIDLSITAQQQEPPAGESSGQQAEQSKGGVRRIEDFDIRAGLERSIERPDAAPPLGIQRRSSIGDGRQSRLLRERPRTRVRWSTLTLTPSRLSNPEEGLSAPSPSGPVSIARKFLSDNRDLFRMRDDEVETLIVSRTDRTAHNGMTHVGLRQRINGLDVFEAEYAMHIASDGRIIAADGELIPGALAAANGVRPGLGAPDALRRAIGSVGREMSVAPSPKSSPAGREQRQRFNGGEILSDETEARLVYFPVSGDQLRLSWEMTIWLKGSPDAWLIVVDATSGSLLYRHSLTWHCFDDGPRDMMSFAGGQPRALLEAIPVMQGGTTPHGLIFAEESPRPNVPVVSLSPPTVERIDVPFQPAPFLGETIFAAGNPHFDWWNGLPATKLTSNNTDTYLDRNADNIPDDTLEMPRLEAADSNFSYPLDLTQQPTTSDNQKAAQVNLFYWVNRYHDILYHFGFRESSGNFQTDNFNLGGIGGDPIRAEAQDGSGTNNANYSGSRDGSPARIQMYLWSGTPQLDGDLDQGIIIHELTHGLSTRLVGNGTGLSGLQARGMGEGWSDYFGLVLLRQSDDDLNGNYAVGQYAVGNYSRGIRRYPYSTNQQVYPLGYGDIGLNINSPHPIGEIWCNTLMEMRAALIGHNGYEEGQRQSIQLVVDGLKLTPSSPSFLDARDAILLADRINNNGVNQCRIWGAFSKHGMGFSAQTLGTNDRSPIESFDQPPFCSDLGSIRFDRKSYLIGETIAVSVGDRNASGALPVQIRSSVTGDHETLNLTLDTLYSSNYLTAIQLTEGQPIPGDGKLQASLRLQDRIIVTYNDADNGSGSAVVIEATAPVGGEKAFFEDDVESGNKGWIAIGAPVNNWAITDQKSASGRRSWTDSPDGNYADEQDTSLVSPLLDLSIADGVSLYFTHSYAFEAAYDYGLVEISVDDGVNWSRVAAFSGIHNDFVRERIQLDSLGGRNRARIRFRILSDENLNFDGWHLDDIQLIVRSSDLNFIPPPETLAPVALKINPAFGSPNGDTPVTIEGLNFTDSIDMKVYFDGIAASDVQVVNGTTLTARTPAHSAGTVGVRLGTRFGTATIASSYTYYSSGQIASMPEVLSIFPTSGRKGGGTVVTVNGNNYTPETTVRFAGQPSMVRYINPNIIEAVTPASATTGQAEVVISNGANLEATPAGGFTYVDPTPPTGQIVNLNGGEKLFSGATYTILWNSSDDRRIQMHKLAIRDGGSQVTTKIADYIEGGARSWNWPVPREIASSNKYRLLLTVIDDEGTETVVESDADFTIERRWESIEDAGVSVQRPAAGSDGNYIYIFGGRATGNSSSTISTVQRYDPVAKTWSTSAVTPMLTGLNAGEAAFLDGKFYIPGGINRQVQISPTHQQYDVASNTWKTLAPAPNSLFLYALAVDQAGGLIYKTGGLDESQVPVTDFHAFNAANGQWSVLPAMPTARFAHESVMRAGRIYVAAGSGTAGGLSSCEVYDPATNKWSALAGNRIRRQYGINALATGADGKDYWLLIGGEDPTTTRPLGTIEAYDFTDNRWLTLDASFDLPTERTRLGGTVFDGAVYALVGAIPASGGMINNDLVEMMSISAIEPASVNQPPIVVVPAEDQIGVAGNAMTFSVSAQDLGSSIPVSVTPSGMPEAAGFDYVSETNNSGRGVFTWTPAPSDTGSSYLVTFTAGDGELTESKSVLLRVVAASQGTAVNAADFRLGPLAANSIAAIFGTDLAIRMESAKSNPLPFDVAGTRLTIGGLPAPLFFVSPYQINFVVPQLLPQGPATLIVSSPHGVWSVAQLNITPAAPAIFTANATGRGDATAQATVDGMTYQQPPFDVTVNGQPNVLVLYGTGFRNAAAADPFDGNGVAEAVDVTIDGQPATVLYAGAQGSFSGLDQINLIIPQVLAGGGQRRVEIRISVNGVEANPTTILIK